MTLSRLEHGGPAYLARQNALVDQLNRLARPGAAGKAQMGSAGITFAFPPPARLGLFELTGPLVHPDGTDPDEPDVPYSHGARPVWLSHAENAYGGGELSPPVTLYHPAALRDPQGRPLGTASLAAGMRCYAWFNRQSVRWEILSSPLGVLRFEMTAALGCGGSAPALVLGWDGAGYGDDPLLREVTVHDATGRFSKMATTEGDRGALGWAQFMPDHAAWEILDMQVPGDFWGALAGDLSRSDASADVEVVAQTGVLGGYNVFGIHHGNTITAYNPAGGGNSADYWHAGREGDRVFCRWDVRNAKYWMLLVEPNDHEYQTLDVVTDVDFVTQTVTTRQIELPPWAVP